MLASATFLTAGLSVPFDGIRNFRTVSASLPGLYRSAALEAATEADAAALLDGFRIRTVLDLRSADEIVRARSAATRAGTQLLAAYERGEPVGPGRLASCGGGCLRRVHVPLLGDVEVRDVPEADQLAIEALAQRAAYPLQTERCAISPCGVAALRVQRPARRAPSHGPCPPPRTGLLRRGREAHATAAQGQGDAPSRLLGQGVRPDGLRRGAATLIWIDR